jgi:hypothetical protein
MLGPEAKAQVTNVTGNLYKGFATYHEAELFYKTGGTIQPQGYYCVTHGYEPGICTTWKAAEEAINGYSDARHQRFETKDEAERHLAEQTGVGNGEVPMFENHFANFNGFEPKPTLPFAEEFDRLASSQQWEKGSGTYRQQRVAAMSKELQFQFSQSTPRVKNEPGSDDSTYESGSDGDNKEELTEEQRDLRVYQNLCREVNKPPSATAEECIVTLKDAPYVNLIDLINTRRTGSQPKTYDSWDEFVRYTTTTPGKKIDLKYAKTDQFLMSLLQNMRTGPKSQQALQHYARTHAAGRGTLQSNRGKKKIFASKPIDRGVQIGRVQKPQPQAQPSSRRDPPNRLKELIATVEADKEYWLDTEHEMVKNLENETQIKLAALKEEEVNMEAEVVFASDNELPPTSGQVSRRNG